MNRLLLWFLSLFKRTKSLPPPSLDDIFLTSLSSAQKQLNANLKKTEEQQTKLQIKEEEERVKRQAVLDEHRRKIMDGTHFKSIFDNLGKQLVYNDPLYICPSNFGLTRYNYDEAPLIQLFVDELIALLKTKGIEAIYIPGSNAIQLDAASVLLFKERLLKEKTMTITTSAYR
jgi:hypothetical protein